MTKARSVAVLSFFTSLIRVLGGPITILLVTSTLSVEEMGFYYTFFSFISMSQLFEVGVSFVLKQYYSHDCKYDDNGQLSSENKLRCGRLLRFSIQWYSGIAIIYFIIIVPVGFLYFFDYSGEVDWQSAYLLLILSTSLRFIVNIIDSYLDGMQRQVLLNKTRFFSSLFMSLTLWASIYLGFDLMSLGISQCVYVIVFVLFASKYRVQYSRDICLSPINYSFKIEVKRIFPLMGRTSMVWFLGYFFWNGFTLLSFKLYGAEMAGKIGLSIALAKGGYDIANSFLINQRTMIANYLAHDDFSSAYRLFQRYFALAFSILMIGYSGIFVIKCLFPSFYLFDNTLENFDLLSIFLFYCLAMVMTGFNNFVRAYKIEPFILLSLYNAFFIPLMFYLTPLMGINGMFTASIIMFIPSIIYSSYYFMKRVKKSKVLLLI